MATTARHRLLTLSLLLAGVGVMLSGCIPASKLYLGLVDGQLAIKTCESIDASSIDISEVTPDSDSVDGEVIWKVSGHAILSIGDVIIVGQPPAGMDTTEVAYAGTFSAADAFGVSIARNSDEPATVFGSYQGADLQAGKWLGTGGFGPIDAPC